MGGYEANFNPPLEDKYKCPVCLTALRDPVQTKCGHRLCSSCFKIIRGGNWYFRCPVDNTWSNHVFEDNAVKREILSLKVECVNNTIERCDWCGELRELQNHLKSCNYEKVDCPNKCKSEVMRLDLDKHLLECPLRLETCEHCQVQVVVSQLARHHVLICPKFPLNCPVCGEVEIMRENINGHINIINGDCPMVVVPCSFRHIGCMHSDHRNKMHKHYVDANTHHLMLLSTRLVDLETKHRLDLELCVKKFDQTLNELKEKLDSSEKRNNHLEDEMRELKKLVQHQNQHQNEQQQQQQQPKENQQDKVIDEQQNQHSQYSQFQSQSILNSIKPPLPSNPSSTSFSNSALSLLLPPPPLPTASLTPSPTSRTSLSLAHLFSSTKPLTTNSSCQTSN